jgi:hypothetical protein
MVQVQIKISVVLVLAAAAVTHVVGLPTIAPLAPDAVVPESSPPVHVPHAPASDLNKQP